MKSRKILKLTWALAPAVLMTACGGGGDAEAGSPTTFSVSPDTVTFTAPTGTAAGVCLSGGTSTHFVYGGSAPYRIDNTVPDYLSIDKTEVSDRGGSFTITVTGGCLGPGTINVVDKLDHVVTLTVNNKPAS
jgi:hypothetical protein